MDADSNIFLASITVPLLYLSLLLSLKFPFQPPHSTLYLSNTQPSSPLTLFLPAITFVFPHISPLSPHSPLFWFIFISHHSPLCPFPFLFPTATQMDRTGFGLSTPANQNDPPQGGASLHYGYIRMNVCC